MEDAGSLGWREAGDAAIRARASGYGSHRGADATPLRAKDHAVYSAVYVLENGQVDPFLIVRDVSSRTPGGDYAEFVDGRWRQLGLVPNPDAIPGTEYIANPHPNDKSFKASQRELQSDMFARFVGRVRGG